MLKGSLWLRCKTVKQVMFHLFVCFCCAYSDLYHGWIFHIFFTSFIYWNIPELILPNRWEKKEKLLRLQMTRDMIINKKCQGSNCHSTSYKRNWSWMMNLVYLWRNSLYARLCNSSCLNYLYKALFLKEEALDDSNLVSRYLMVLYFHLSYVDCPWPHFHGWVTKWKFILLLSCEFLFHNE